jgi:hypothetical protein
MQNYGIHWSSTLPNEVQLTAVEKENNALTAGWFLHNV